MAELLLLTPEPGTLATVLPALDFLPHHVNVLPLDPSVLVDAPAADAVLLDARRDLSGARATARLLHSTGLTAPLLLVVTEGGLTAINSEWGARDFLLANASPAEVEARIRLALSATPEVAEEADAEEISNGDLFIDPVAYTARLRRRHLDLTYKEFELLRYLAQHPGRVFTRTQLLQEVWGYDYYGGTRTIDVHVRRLRAKLGAEYEHLIGTVRNVGYRFTTQQDRRTPADSPQASVASVSER
ncbi:MAG: response regulator transcription factor [Bifidobacteriaceae bacterium]|jgi:DNA-binding response OmpR family regulator|nr:response regulator transcription factor [Bifidobacteriaceae bacterium]